MTVAHKNLTGVDLHEPKGIAAAAIDKVYVSDGAGSGAWQKIERDQLDATAGGNSFSAQLLLVRDEKASGTAGGGFSSGAWRTRTLNTTLTNEITSASLSSNQITLPAGVYWIDARAPANFTNSHQTKLRNITDGSDTLMGSTAYAEGTQSDSVIRGRFTIAGSKVFELQHRCETSVVTDGFGNAAGFGNAEVYAEVLVWKL